VRTITSDRGPILTDRDLRSRDLETIPVDHDVISEFRRWAPQIDTTASSKSARLRLM
jgi:hypothetical protein